jgi:glyoxylase I family protein
MERGAVCIHHVGIVASSYEQAVWFYCNLLGLVIHKESYSAKRKARKLQLYCQDQYAIELFIPEKGKACTVESGYTKACVNHISFLVSDVAKMLDCMRQNHIETEGVNLDGETGKRYGFCYGPDGVKIELYEM